AGLVAGGAVHTAMAALGAGLLLKLFPAAFNAVLVAGALYVAWMGVGLWRSPATMSDVEAGTPRTLLRTFTRAMATCLLNPKAYVFMVAVFPQFIRPDAGPVLQQAVALAAIIAVTQAVVYGAVAVGAAGLRAGLRDSVAAQAALGRSVAALLVGTAGWALWTGWSAA
ncbi:MAG TPA: LysE family translocator, partial [Ramlibacter sp.]|nr:LysE family translocator [Ramlibacter sp.]